MGSEIDSPEEQQKVAKLIYKIQPKVDDISDFTPKPCCHYCLYIYIYNYIDDLVISVYMCFIWMCVYMCVHARCIDQRIDTFVCTVLFYAYVCAYDHLKCMYYYGSLCCINTSL